MCEADQAEIAASNSLSQASHVRVQPRSDKNLARVCCSEVLEQPCEGTALFSRKKEKEVSRNYNLFFQYSSARMTLSLHWQACQHSKPTVGFAIHKIYA